MRNLKTSVPIRGLFNLTRVRAYDNISITCVIVSVPIRGLFNLTVLHQIGWIAHVFLQFPSPLGDYLI